LWPRFLRLFLFLSASFSGSVCVSFCALKFLFHELDSSRRCKQCDLGFVVPMCVRVCAFWFWNACFVLLSLLTLIFVFLFKKLSWKFVILFMRFLRFFPCCKCGLGFGTFSVFCYFFANLSTVCVLRMSELQFRSWRSATSTWKRIIVHVSGKSHGKNLKKDKLERATIQDCILFFAFCFPACAAVSQTPRRVIMFISQGLSSRLCNVLSNPTSRDCRSCEPRVLHRYFYQVAMTNATQHLLFLSLVSCVCVCLSLCDHLSTCPSSSFDGFEIH
jgi:hypothetical protein